MRYSTLSPWTNRTDLFIVHVSDADVEYTKKKCMVNDAVLEYIIIIKRK